LRKNPKIVAIESVYIAKKKETLSKEFDVIHFTQTWVVEGQVFEFSAELNSA
jgi:hypothetical protein